MDRLGSGAQRQGSETAQLENGASPSTDFKGGKTSSFGFSGCLETAYFRPVTRTARWDFK